MRKNIILILLFIILVSVSAQEECKIELVQIQEGVERPSLPNQISSTHFIVHYDINDISLNYAQDILDGAEYAYQKQCVEMGWDAPPTDDNRGGDNRYDIYIMNISSKGATFWEVLPDWTEEWAPSFIKINNQLATLSDRQMVIAHEFNHMVQLGYTYKDNFWFFENTATYVAELCYDWAYNYYQHYTGSGPLKNPEYRVDFIGYQEGYEYNGFIWPQFLQEWTGDNTILQNIWRLMRNNPGDNVLDDINSTLQSSHGLSLQDALRNYVEWRFFTGNYADDSHFHNASEYQEANITFGLGNTNHQVTGPGGSAIVAVFSNPDSYLEVYIDGDDTVKFDAFAIRLEGSATTANQLEIVDIELDGNQDGHSFIQGADIVLISVVIETTTGYRINFGKYVDISVSEANVLPVTFRNEKESDGADLGGSFKVDNQTVFSDNSILLSNNSIVEATTNDERFSQNKHKYWNNTQSEFRLSHSFEVNSDNSTQRAKFGELQSATISIKVEGSEIESPYDSVKFNDPWYLKLDGTQSGMGDFLTFPAPYEPTGKEGETNGGVFLNQNPSFDPLLPGYKVSISPTQTINYNNRSHKIYFNSWSHNGKADFQDAELTTTPVVFTDGDAEVYANHKGSLMSGTDAALRGPSQRKIARNSDGYYHLVYESMGRVWYEVHTSNEWYFIPPVEVNEPATPLSNSEALYPTISVNGNNSVVVYQENANGLADIGVKANLNYLSTSLTQF